MVAHKMDLFLIDEPRIEDISGKNLFLIDGCLTHWAINKKEEIVKEIQQDECFLQWPLERTEREMAIGILHLDLFLTRDVKSIPARVNICKRRSIRWRNNSVNSCPSFIEEILQD